MDDTVREDLGYRRPRMDDRDQERVYKMRKVPMIRIEYKNGIMAGRQYWIREDIARDLIRHGKALEVK